jgi:hypothetical protein
MQSLAAPKETAREAGIELGTAELQSDGPHGLMFAD